MSSEKLTIWVGQGNYAEQRNVTIWSNKCRLFLITELVRMNRKGNIESYT